MRCIYPLRAFQTPDGSIHFKEQQGRETKWLELPCGQCIECRLERTRQWAVRITHETQMHEHNWFVTLTYNKDHEPRGLEHEHFQVFIRATRKKYGPLRYYMCGEYGEQKGRPHFHAIIFGLKLTDLKPYDKTLYTSATLEKIWAKGGVRVGAVTFESASYVASYCTKKITGAKAQEHYTRTDLDTGEIYEIEPEYARMSLKPGIGKAWIQKYGEDVYAYDHVIINGRPQKPPRFYDKELEKINPTRLEKAKAKRQERAKDINEEENTRQRLDMRQTVTKARLKQRQRKI